MERWLRRLSQVLLCWNPGFHPRQHRVLRIPWGVTPSTNLGATRTSGCDIRKIENIRKEVVSALDSIDTAGMHRYTVTFNIPSICALYTQCPKLMTANLQKPFS